MKDVIFLSEKFEGDSHVFQDRVVELEGVHVNDIIVLHVLTVLLVHLLLLIELC